MNRRACRFVDRAQQTPRLDFNLLIHVARANLSLSPEQMTVLFAQPNTAVSTHTASFIFALETLHLDPSWL